MPAASADSGALEGWAIAVLGLAAEFHFQKCATNSRRPLRNGPGLKSRTLATPAELSTRAIAPCGSARTTKSCELADLRGSRQTQPRALPQFLVPIPEHHAKRGERPEHAKSRAHGNHAQQNKHRYGRGHSTPLLPVTTGPSGCIRLKLIILLGVLFEPVAAGPADRSRLTPAAARRNAGTATLAS
jgi:hypothetical protein